MKMLIVYDSLFGNLKIIAEAMREAIPGDINIAARDYRTIAWAKEMVEALNSNYHEPAVC